MEQTPPSWPEIVEFYSGYVPRVDVKVVVSRLMDYVPRRYLAGIRSVILTNKGSLCRQRRRSSTKARGRKVRVVDTAGLYHPCWQGQAAWIEIFVDEILDDRRIGWWLKVPWVPEFLISSVLYHELGHHIQATIRPEFREPEDVAEHWRRVLFANYVRKRHWWLLPLLYPVRAFIAGYRKTRWWLANARLRWRR